MLNDPRERAVARAIYDAVYPTEEWAPVSFDDAERLGTVHYRQVLEAASIIAPMALDDPAQGILL